MSILVASIGAQASVCLPGKSYIMTSSQQEMLRKAWLEGRHGNLCALSEAMLWAVREVWRAEKRSLHGLQTFAAGLVTKVGTGEHPSSGRLGYSMQGSTPILSGILVSLDKSFMGPRKH